MTSKPKALAILIGAGPTSGLGIARTLVQNGYGVACLARNADRLKETVEKIRQQTGQKAVEGFSTDTQPSNLTSAFEKIREHPSFEGLKLKLALFHIKHSSREPFLETSPESYGKALEEYNVGAFAFAQQVLKRSYEESGGQTTLKESGGEKKCTLIFTGTLGALRTNTNFAAYGSTRSAARSLAQAIAKEHSTYGIHVAHAIANGSIRDEDSEDTRTGVAMSAQAVGEAYLYLAQQSPSLWTHELDLRPAQEKF